ncbi:MAG: pilus assembly protein CpaC [Pseudomonadota bacterium]|nr:pilus assembly protein CpaC [Pseudomonadota bacterium]
MLLKTSLLTALALGALSSPAGAAPAPAPAGAPAPGCTEVRPGAPVQVAVGKSVMVRPTAPVARIVLGNPAGMTPSGGTSASTRPGVAEVDVVLLGPSEVHVLGKALGTTNVVMLDRQGRCTSIDVSVGMDVSALQALITQLLPEEKEVRVSAAFDSIVLSGSVSDGEALTRITDLANAFVRSQQGGAAANPRIVNMTSVAAPQQVMLEVKVAEVSKSLIDKLGAQLSASGTRGNWTYALLADFLSSGNAALSALRASNLSLSIDAQKTDGLVKVLAEPNVMAISGQTGSFLAGGKIFIPVASTSSNGTREVTLEEKEFGVSLRFTPTVLGGGRIHLRVRPEVSELNREGVGITASGVSGTSILPAFTSRKAETTVQLMDGQSFAIGGLIKNNTTTSIKAFPFLGELPVLGALFRSTEFQSDRSELVFVVTPRLVKPLEPGYRLPTDAYREPSRQDLMLMGRSERALPPQAATPAAPTSPEDGGLEPPAPTEARP